MKIFENYTGNAMLNNALMTIEALGNLSNVSEITPDLLSELFESKNLPGLNKRLKSYTMLFSLNNPLVNPAKKKDRVGEKTYRNLMSSISKNYESKGSLTCEISGLKFDKKFESFYEDEISNQKEVLRVKKLDPKEEKKLLNNLDNTDYSLNRTWFPLIGGLGSDAQALPQAKFSIQIHPICIVILQFLPLSALLFKGGILLLDSSNFEFSKRYIAGNQKLLSEKIEFVKSGEPIENVRDFSKGSYILKALTILEDHRFDDEYSDLNLWSFSNSGTGASCSIDRIPNSLFKKLNRFYNNPEVSSELKMILNNPNGSDSFLSSLDGNIEWWLLYPNVFKKIKYEGVSVKFLEAYFNIIGSSQKVDYAKYLADLVNRYKTKTFEKYLVSTSAWNESDYRVDLYKVMIEATSKGEWSFYNQLNILDNPDQLPIKNTFYKLHKLVHFYYQKNTFSNTSPELKTEESKAKTIAEWLIGLIQNDVKRDSIIKDLKDPQRNSSVRYTGLMLRSFENSNLNLDGIISALFDENLNISVFGLNELLRLFFIQKEQQSFDDIGINLLADIEESVKEKLNDMKQFAADYQAYYFAKYGNKETGAKPYKRFLKLITNIPIDTSKFLYWFREAVEKTNDYLIADGQMISEKWSEDLLHNHNGDFAISFAKLATKFTLLKEYHGSVIELNQTIN